MVSRVAGFYPDIPNLIYHSDKEWISSSQIKYALESAHHYDFYVRKSSGAHEDTKAKLFGSLVHKLVLEPNDFHNEYVVLPEVKLDLRKKADKAIWTQFQEDNKGLIHVTDEDYTNAKKCSTSIMSHKSARALFEMPGIAEASLYVEIEHTMPDGEIVKFKVRIRPDWLIKDHAIVDLKTSKDPSIRGFSNDAFKPWGYHYDLSGALYVKAWKAYSGVELPFIWVVVNNDDPFQTAVYRMSDERKKDGEKKLSDALTTIIMSERNGSWEFQPETEEI